METGQKLLEIQTCGGVFPFVRNPLVASSDAFREWFRDLTGILFGRWNPAVSHYIVAESTPENQLADRVEGMGVSGQCLFSGEAVAQLRYASPWLIEVNSESSLLRQLMSESTQMGAIWGKQPTVVIGTTVPKHELLGHLRRFIYVRADGAMGGHTFFRFWEAGVLPEYFHRTAYRPQNLPFLRGRCSPCDLLFGW